jgi:hypothetical protein
MKRRIDLTNPKLGSELLKDAKGEFPIDVWDTYFWDHSERPLPVWEWSIDPSDPELAPIDPQRAVDEAEPLLQEAMMHLRSDPDQALVASQRAHEILVHGSSYYQPKRGQISSMRPIAVRAYIIRKFNPHPDKPGQSSVGWDRLADLLFANNGKCPRCRLAEHRYYDPCVRTLMTAVTRLRRAMKRDGIPV